MESSVSYVAIEAMIRQGWVIMSFAELEQHLATFEKKGLLTSSEREALLDLARKLNRDKDTGLEERK